MLIGVIAGDWLLSNRSDGQKARGLAIGGLVLLFAGELWSVALPINKKMWTSSFALFTAGAALVCLALCYWLIDLRKGRVIWTRPFVIFGVNAITAYVLSEVLAIVLWKIHVYHKGRWLTAQDYLYRLAFSAVRPAPLASLAFSISFVVVCFLPLWWMYRKQIFLKV